jgi:hypothetical protein
MARLFHVTEPMFAVSKLLSEKLDASEVWSLDALPAPYGVLVFETSIYTLDVWEAQTSYAAVIWNRTSRNHGQVGTLYNLYSDLDDVADYYNLILNTSASEIKRDCGRWLWDHSMFVADGESVVEGYPLEKQESDAREYRETHEQESVLPEEIAASIRSNHPFRNANEVVKALYAAFTLMGETRMVDQNDLTDKKLARRNQHKKNRPAAMVTVIQLRRPDHYGYYEKDTGTWLTYRSWTSAHRRRVHYGPGRKEVKWIWINSYLRGPNDAPIRHVDRVNTLAR